MSREIIINKYEDNTHYSVHVKDSFNQEHHLGYWSELDNSVMLVIEAKARGIWANEVKNEPSTMSKAIAECIKLDREAGITSGNRDCLD